MRYGPAVLLAFLLVSCSSSQADRRTSVLWTDSSAMTTAVERYNASQGEWQILLEYRTDLAAALMNPGEKPDLVVGFHLDPTAVKTTLASLDFVFDRGQATRSQFYRGLLEAGTMGTELRALPLAFDLPILVYSTKRLPDLDPQTIQPETVRELSGAFDRKNGLQMPFSPLWDEFPLTVLHLGGVAFGENFQGGLSWADDSLGTSLDNLTAWTVQSSGSWKAQREFTLKYLSTSPWPLLREGRILLYPTRLSEFVALPLDERRDLDFRFLEVGGWVAASDRVLWAGIPASASQRGAAQDFIANLLTPSTQASLVDSAFTGDFRPFGFLGALSSEVATNSVAITKRYPELEGRVPLPSHIKFWAALPVTWPILRNAVVTPWLAKGPDKTQGPELRTAVDNWGKPQQ